jgi:DNA-binding protein HU-beta
MTRADLIASMAAASGWSHAASARALRALLAAVKTSLRRGRPVTLVGFGTFSAVWRRSRTGKNPRTGQPMAVAAGRVPRFRPSREMKRAVR